MNKNRLQNFSNEVQESEVTTVQNLENYFTVRQFTEKFPFMTQSGLRYMIFHAEKNGFKSVIRRIGSKVLINAQAFEQWLEKNNGRNIVTGRFN